MDKRDDRKFQLLTVVLAGLIGLVGAFGGTYGALKVTDKQIAAQREDSRDQFLRDQRRSAYGTMITLDSQLNVAELGLQFPTAQSPRAAAKEVQTKAVKANALVDRLQTASSTVVLIGSSALANAGDSLVSAHRAYVGGLDALAGIEYVVTITPKESAEKLLRKVRAQVQANRRDLTTAQSQFLARARLELANGIDLEPLDLDSPTKSSSGTPSD